MARDLRVDQTSTSAVVVSYEFSLKIFSHWQIQEGYGSSKRIA